jgi:hypothetical protein
MPNGGFGVPALDLTHPELALRLIRPSVEGIFLDFSCDLFGFGKLEVSGEEEEGEGDADGGDAGEDDVEPGISYTDALTFYRHEHRCGDRDKEEIVGEGSGGSIDVGGINEVHEGVVGLLHEGDII